MNFLKKKNKKNAKLTLNSFDGNLDDFKSNEHSEKMIVFESWLNKKGNVNKGWKRRYVVAYTDRKLAYFAQMDDKEPKGFINLKDVTCIEYVSLFLYSEYNMHEIICANT